jgi:two-component system chemotaxis sensor kinase CheA
MRHVGAVKRFCVDIAGVGVMDIEEVKKVFGQEADELLVEMEDALLALEDSPADSELINSLFRAMHTIKGAAGIFNFIHIVEFTHPIETEVEKLRTGELMVTPDLIATLFKCRDHTVALVEHAINGEEDITTELKDQGDAILLEFGISASDTDDDVASSDIFPSASSDDYTDRLTESPYKSTELEADCWVISLDFQENALRNGLDPLSFIRYLCRMGNIVDILTLVDNIPAFEGGDFEGCYLKYRIAFKTDATREQIEEVFEFAQDDCTIIIIPSRARVSQYLETIETLTLEDSERLGKILVNIGAITRKELTKALGLQDNDVSTDTQKKRIGDILVEQKIIDQPVVEQAQKKQQQAREQTQSIRVDSDKLGQLINLVGELVTSSAAMKIIVDQHHIDAATEVVAGVEHLVEEIRDTALQLRMVQIGETFSRFRRVTRDVSKEQGKKIELVISGGEAELDKTVVEKISDPLTHLVRNALDHGIELPEVRIANGKPAQGKVELNAYHDSGHIVIEVVDDGGGLDPDKIRAKAERLGLVDPDQILSRAETFRLIFEAGLSTKAEASNLSGRGVGMDVVRRNIESLRGSIELDSELGVGTRITINLPLTLAIIDGFMVGAGKERYVIPLSMVEECIEIDSEEWSEDKQRHFINLRGEVMPFLRLRDFFSNNEAHTTKRESLVVVKFGRYKAGFVVDRLFGEQQTVIKPLGSIFQHLKGVSGATILGTGEIALILDVQGLVQIASSENKISNRHSQPQQELQIN